MTFETERDFQRWVVKIAKEVGWSVQHNADSRRSHPGWPDLVLWRGRRALFRELKTDKGRLTEAQVSTLEGLTKAGLDVRVWRPKDKELILRELSG